MPEVSEHTPQPSAEHSGVTLHVKIGLKLCVAITVVTAVCAVLGMVIVAGMVN
ncbi:hypothetical protein BDW27_106349 [Nocardiopsis sp. L17-MgMaSL7]|nr:hypothetical protein BDW27_106349 [Nocardiopsis sp. L17-MgMaSL7]